MKKYQYLYLILISVYSYSQQSYTFESKIHPEKEYRLKMNISSINETTIENETTKSESITKVTKITTTEKTNTLGLFPASMRFENVTSNENGKEILNPISNTIIIGQIAADNKFKIDTIYNPKINQKTRDALKSVFKDLKPDIDFPKKSLKIGDSFENKVPINIPINGQQVKILMTKTFTLKNVIKNIAVFAVNENFSLNMESIDITETGEGSGIVEFDISENHIIKESSHFTIKLNLKTDEGNIIGFIKSDSEKTTTISNIIIEEPPKTAR